MSEENQKSYKFWTPPPAVGWWVLPGAYGGNACKIACYTKPRWLNIKLMKYLLGFGYEEIYEREN